MIVDRKKGLVLIGLLLAVFCLSLRGTQKPVKLPSGWEVTLANVKVGYTNTMVHGSMLEKVLAPVMPTNGFKLFGHQLQRPERDVYHDEKVSSIVAEFHFTHPNEKLSKGVPIMPEFYRQHRLIVYGDDGFERVEEFRDYKRYHDGKFGKFYATTFPRTAKTVHFRIEERAEREGPWFRGGEFIWKNPSPVKAEAWAAEAYPVSRTVGNVQVTVGEITVDRYPSDYHDIWENRVLVPFQVKVDGHAVTNWTASQIEATDSSGNRQFFGGFESVTNGWIWHRSWRPADPHQVWRLKMGFSPDSGFAASNVFTVQLSASLPGPILTNAGGYPIKIGVSDGDALDMEMLTNPPNVRVTFLRAEDERGTNIAQPSGSWGQHRFRRIIKASGGTNSVLATFAIHQNVPLEFAVKPRLVSEGERQDGKK